MRKLKEAISQLARALQTSEIDIVEALDYDNKISIEDYEKLRKWCEEELGQ